MARSPFTAHLAVPALGLSNGMRTLTPIAATAWFAYADRLPVRNTWASWVAHPASVGLFTAAAIGECIADKLPSTPARTKAVGVIGRVAFGGLVGAIVATALRRRIVSGATLGVAGALAGTYGGYYARRGLTRNAGIPDLPVALAEDSLAISTAVVALRALTA